ncbi:enoyl-CoA hydratase/isomerase family protein [Granulosicoccaceae sp. 1_MG-2023]|nr:enoyl-CoA hydratase/isomerase family protein [Granulosicoccaceae sp. 1_MG-2023]
MSKLIDYRKEGNTGLIRLDRPEVYNALNTAMISRFGEALEALKQDDEVALILVESDHPKAFCAGGDMRTIRDLALAGRDRDCETFFATEYAVNLAIGHLEKPYVALIDGICMGGGIGLSVHGRFRVATEKARFAMPECKLGFFPDIGGSFFLPRVPDQVGPYLALSGETISGEDALAAGLATHFVRSEKLPDLRRALIDAPGKVGATLADFAETPPVGPLQERLGDIKRVFSAESVAGVKAALADHGDDWSHKTLEQINAGSPLSVDLTWAMLERGRQLDLAACLEADLATTRLMIRHPDFIEGTRAILVDKDRKPSWTTTPAE